MHRVSRLSKDFGYDVKDPYDRKMALDVPYSQLNEAGRKEKAKLDALSAERARDGSWNLSAVKNGYLIHMKYKGYSKKVATRRFMDHLDSL